ncbi:MAG: hypothetical protein K5906_02820 [Bacilli bacterium]|nr:hypothetical protein [Bacilli bacterium]
MFDHFIAVLDYIRLSLKKYLNITSIVTQLLFMSYYAYLIVINVNDIKYLLAYSFIEGFAFIILIVDIFTSFSELTRHGKRIKAKWKRIINYGSWVAKAIVIGFNISLIVKGEATEAGKIFLIFSAVVLILQIMVTIISSLFTYYIDLMMYGLKMDYESLVDKEEAKVRPVGKLLNKMTKDIDYRDNIDKYSVHHEMRGTIKKELEKEYPLKINNKIVKRKKVEKVILHYYKKANKYYISSIKLKSLIEELKEHHITYLTSDDKLYVFLFFAYNHLKCNFKGLSEYATKLIIACLLFIIDGNDRSMVDVIYRSITKELFDIANWSKIIKKPDDESEVNKVITIVKASKEEYKKNREETIASEFKDLAIQEIEAKVNLPKPISKVIHHFLKRKKKDD